MKPVLFEFSSKEFFILMCSWKICAAVCVLVLQFGSIEDAIVKFGSYNLHYGLVCYAIFHLPRSTMKEF